MAIDMPEAEKVCALAGTSNMNLSTIFYTVGTPAVSGDIVMKENGPSNAMRSWSVKELRSLLKWKMNPEEFLA